MRLRLARFAGRAGGASLAGFEGKAEADMDGELELLGIGIDVCVWDIESVITVDSEGEAELETLGEFVVL